MQHITVVTQRKVICATSKYFRCGHFAMKQPRVEWLNPCTGQLNEVKELRWITKCQVHLQLAKTFTLHHNFSALTFILNLIQTQSSSTSNAIEGWAAKQITNHKILSQVYKPKKQASIMRTNLLTISCHPLNNFSQKITSDAVHCLVKDDAN